MPRKSIHPLLFSLVGLTMLASVPAGGAAPASGAESAFASRISYIEKLVERSSVARQIAASTNIKAKDKQRAAQSFYRQALDAHKDGDDKLAYELLNGAIRIMGEAARLAAGNEVLEEKRKQDYQVRLDTINALLAAYDRIGDEHGGVDENYPLRPTIRHWVSQAEKLSARGELILARNRLDQAYNTLTAAIEKIRGGHTLVHQLHFATRKDEYHYETGRNRSHRMLVKVLFEDKMRSSPNDRQLVKELMSQADEALANATRYAEVGDYDAAIAVLETSTAHIVRAIRGAGIYIPG